MHELTFYRQKRYDGGVRMGIELDKEHTLLATFLEGPLEEQENPLAAALLWYFDLRCRGDEVPTQPDRAREWFRSFKDPIRSGLEKLATAISLGVDDSTPIQWSDFEGFPAGVHVEAVLSAIRRISNDELLQVIEEIADKFDTFLGQLSQVEPATF